MSMKKQIIIWLLAGIFLSASLTAAAGTIPVKDTVTMADIGSTTCIPCKMMNPVLKNLRAAYANRAAVIFVDIHKDRSVARKFGLRAIPTQIFFDKNGKEQWRHVGFLDQKSAAAKLDALLGN